MPFRNKDNGYTQNNDINSLIDSCGGMLDFRDIVIMENCKTRDYTNALRIMQRRHYGRKLARRKATS